ncbi:ABC transporter ATP-binding protein [Magnetospirillum fulvum]|uniref:Iron complex transport system ATP-binding protein n=1 Tax=Magnetospirillum fulvum TaxID=1082 RepID=A0A1H6IQ71_MAGFU|nr:ABC transporter ATP-binding protein [Magnetospirillum fulvum]SEH51307.1 iron complex transport system ATP-binding protein [Magnetospirillum fulvum]
MSALVWESVSLRRGGRLVLAEIALRVEPGELLGLVGPNGAGKSTALRCAAGLERPSAGQITLGGVPLDSLDTAARARAVAFLPQQAQSVWPIPVEAAVALGRLPHGGGGTRRDRDAVDKALEAVGITPLRHRPITALSGGERALALLARTLAVESDLLLLDEPCAALDPHHRLAVMELLGHLAAAGRGIAVVLHDLALAARFCHRVAVLSDGKLLAAGPSEATLSDALLAQAFGIRAHRGRIGEESLLIPWQRTAGPHPAGEEQD